MNDAAALASLSELGNHSLVAIGAGALFMIGWCVWELRGGDLTVRLILGGAAWVGCAVAGPAWLGWPLDSSFVAGGVSFAVIVVGGRVLGFR